MSLKKNSILNIAGSAIPLFVGALSISILIEELGIELFGILTILWVIIGYFSLFDFGVGRALTQQISAEKNVAQIPSLVKAGINITLLTGAFGAALLFFASDYLAFHLLNVSPQFEEDVRKGLLIASIGIPIATVSAGLRGVLEGYEYFLECNIAKIIMGSSLFLAPVISVILFESTIFNVACSLVIARIVGLFMFLYYASVAINLKNALKQSVGGERYKKLLSFGGWMSISNLLSPILVNIDRFFISNILGAASVAFYTLPFEFIVRLLIVPGAIGTALLPNLSKKFPDHKEIALASINKAVLYVVAFSIVCIVLTILFGKFLLNFFAGEIFGDVSYTVSILIAFGVLVNGVGYIYYTALHALAMVKVTAKIHLIEFILYIPFVFYMIGEYGVVGAAVSWFVRTSVDSALMFIFFKRFYKNV
jgi:O-antigen/teichoic acid export membrane protein